MSHSCGVCDGPAEMFCRDCPKIKFYCKICFESLHTNNPRNASHKCEPLFSDEGVSKAIVEIFCSNHPNKLKEYACVSCNKSVCSDCIAYAPHKGHTMATFQEGFNKLIKEYNVDVHKDDKYEDLSNENKAKISEFLRINAEKMKSMKAETESNFQKIIELITNKKKEILDFIEKEIDKVNVERSSLDGATLQLKSATDTCNEKLKQSDKVECDDYDCLEKAFSEIKRLRTFLAKWLSVDALKERAYPAISLNPIEKMITSLKIDERSFDIMAEPIFKDSTIITKDEEQILAQNWVSEACNDSKVKFKLLWRGSTNGFRSSAFHSKCDNKGATFTIIKSDKNYVFGGYTSKSWQNSGEFSYDSKAFTYSLTQKEKHADQKDHQNSVYYDSRFGPIFGSGFDICIVDNCNTSQKSYCQGNSTYKLPENVTIQIYYAGAFKYKVKDIEVYSVSTQ